MHLNTKVVKIGYLVSSIPRTVSGPHCTVNLCSVLPYLAIYREYGYFWHNFATKISFWLLGLFGYFFGYFWKIGKKLVLNQFKTGFGSISLCFDVDIFAFWKSFDVDILGF